MQSLHLLDVSFDVPKHVVRIQIVSEIRHETVTVTNVDQRPCIWKLGLHQEVLCPLWVVEIRLSGYTLDFFDLSCLGSRFNVLEVDLRVLTAGYQKVKI